FVRLALEAVGEAPAIHVLDCGCGASYLTFSLHHVLRKKRRVTVQGIDVRADAIERSLAVARALGVAGEVTFARAAIKDAKVEAPDLVLSLHACDTATDEALARAVELGARAILAAPCCQHELHRKIDSGALSPLLRHGILRERLADLATDGIRALVLR